MPQTSTRHWRAPLVRGVAAILFGIVLLAVPEVGLALLVGLFLAYALINGTVWLWAAVAGEPGISRSMAALNGIVDIGAGAVVLLWPTLTEAAVPFAIGVWALVRGALQVGHAWQIGRHPRREWLLVIGGALSILMGVALLAWPATGLLTLVWLIGAYALILGLIESFAGLRMRQIA